MKLTRVTLPRPAHIGAIGALVDSIDHVRHQGVELDYDEKTQILGIFKGPKLTIILPSGVVADVADHQENDDAPGEPAGPPARRGRPKKDPASVQG